MNKTCCLALLIGLAPGLMGCGTSDKGSSASGDASVTAAISAPNSIGQASGGVMPGDGQAAKQAALSSDSPAGAVHDFLEAVRSGNDEKTRQMLTPLARQKVAEHHMNVAPPSRDSAHFEVGEVQMVGEDGARVTVKWTDLDEDGHPSSYETLWMVRHESEGWRIAGVAAPVFEGQPPLVLNFEDPEDMVRKRKLVREEEERQAAEATQATPEGPAGVPGGPAQPQREATDSEKIGKP